MIKFIAGLKGVVTLFRKENLALLFDEDSAILYSVLTGGIKKMTINDGKILEKFLNLYWENKLIDSDKEKLETYLKKMFEDNIRKKRLPAELCKLSECNHLGRFEIFLTNACNLDCVYCYANGGSYGLQPTSMKKEDLLMFLNNLFPNRFDAVDIVMFFGGEPLLNTDSIWLTCEFFNQLYCKGSIKKIPKYTIVTNGTLITEEIAKKLKKYDIQVTVSFDGEKIFQDKLRPYKNGTGSFQDVFNAIKLLSKYKIKDLAIESTYTTYHVNKNYSREELRDYLIKMFPDVKIMIIDCSGNTEYALNYINTDINQEKFEINKMTLSILSKINSKYFHDFSCGSGLNAFILMPNGDLYPCHQFIIDKKYCIGNATSVNSIGKNDYVNSLLDSVKCNNREPCKHCWARELCLFCPATVLYRSDSYINVDLCERKRKIYKNLLFKYLS